MASTVFLGFIALSLWLALRAGKGRGSQSVHDFFVASRQFGAWLVFFLAAGEIYSIGTMVGFPGGIYAKGPTYGVWFLGYILLAYPIGYFVGPKIWEAGKRYNAITLPDLFKGHFGSRALELIVADFRADLSAAVGTVAVHRARRRAQGSRLELRTAAT